MHDQGYAYVYNLESPVETPPTRVVSLVPSLTESLFDLNLGSRLVGITDYCVHPVGKLNSLSRVGGPKNPDIQAIIDLGPELVFMSQEDNRRSDADALRAAGVPVWVTFPRSVQDVFNLLWAIMDVFDETSMVPRIRLIEQSYDWTLGASMARPEGSCRVFVPIWYDPLMTFNNDTYMHDLLRVCGGINVFAERQRRFPLEADVGDDPRVTGRDVRYPRISMDEVIAAQPDVILLPDEPFVFGQEHVAVFRALDVPAAHYGRIHLIEGALLTWPGTRVAYALQHIPPLLCLMEEI